MKTKPLMVALLLTLIAPGCKGDATPDAPSGPAPESSTAATRDEPPRQADAAPPAPPAVDVAAPSAPAPVVTAAGTLAPVPPPLVTLLDAGAEPRTALRLAATAGQVERATIAMGMRVETRVDGAAAVTRAMPRGRMELEARVEAVSEHGEATWVVTVVEAAVAEADVVDEGGADPALIASMREALGAVAGARAGGRVTDRGVTDLAAFEARADLDDEARRLLEGFRESLQQLAVPLPAERVGPGARWQVEQIVSQGGLQIRQTTVFDLVGVSEGGRVDLRASFTQVAEAEADGGPLPPGGRLLAFAGSGTGEVTLDLGRVLPSSSRARVDTHVRMAVPAGDGQSQEIVLAMEIELALGSGGADEGAAE